MEAKVVIYIIAGILYVLYSIGKKAQEKAKANQPVNAETDERPLPQTVSPPAHDPLKEVRREIERKRAEMEARKKAALPKQQPMLSRQQPKAEKEIFIKEKKKATFGQGTDDAPVYEDEIVEKQKIIRGDVRLKNEGIYQIQTMEEARAESELETPVYEFDAKQAFIGSVIFERRY